MWINTPRLVIAAPASGSGKSTVATGLMAALARTHVVQGFKVGPDYIDPMYHTAATGRPSRNLDTWMVPVDQAGVTFGRATRDVDIAIIEGVMGLFDGYGAATDSGSTAEVAKLLGAPVILVLDVGKMARSAGAMALGYRDFDPDLHVAGVICNRVASERHAAWVTQAVEAVGLPVLGCLPKSPALHIPERHLGLHTAVERQAEVAKFLDRASALVARHVDLEGMWRVARGAMPFEVDLTNLTDLAGLPGPDAEAAPRPVVRLAVARDEAFCFYYEDNLDLLRDAGAEIVFFSPLRDKALPERTGGLYLGGGYPELYGAQLAANEEMRAAIVKAHAAGMPVYAECGGLMVLTQCLIDLEGIDHLMLGLLPGRSQIQERLTMGYRQVEAARDGLLLRRGQRTRGHEFHYSDWIDHGPLPHAYEITPRRGERSRQEGIAQGHLLASYVHLHFCAHPDLARNFVRACASWQKTFKRRQG
jgi:cobyrinic acid a,c-diamide synthase